MSKQLFELIDRRALPRMQPLLLALRQADRARAQLREAEQAIKQIISDRRDVYADDDEEIVLPAADLTRLQTAWRQFTYEGGVTESDLRDWLEGKPITRLNNKPGHVRKHLYLVATRAGIPRIRLNSRSTGGEPPEAA